MGLLFIQVVHDAHSCVLTMIIDTWTAVFLFLNLLELVGGNGLLSGASNSHLRYIPQVGRYLYCLAEEKQIIEKDILRVSHCKPPGAEDALLAVMPICTILNVQASNGNGLDNYVDYTLYYNITYRNI